MAFGGRIFKYPLVCCALLPVLLVAGRKGRAGGGCDSMLSMNSPLQPQSDKNGDIHTRSLSPWTWTPNTVEDRIPHTIWEAECVGGHCSTPGDPDGAVHNSMPVMQNILVLSRNRTERCHTASYLSVAVGCTCVRAQTL